MRRLQSLTVVSLMYLVVACQPPAPSSIGDTATLTITPSRTPKPSNVPTLTRTPSLITPAPTLSAIHAQSMRSPDGMWEAEASFERLSDGYRVKLVVSSAVLRSSWTPVDYAGHGEGYTYPFLRYWSPDSLYFFYLERVAGGSCDSFPVEERWKRLDVTNGQVDDYRLPRGRGMAFSPDGRLLAFASEQLPSRLYLQELSAGSELVIDLPPNLANVSSTQAGGILWNPTSAALILVAATSDFCGAVAPTFDLLRYDVGQDRLDLIMSGSTDALRPRIWHVNDVVLIEDWDGRTWWIDPATGRTVPAPADISR